MRLEYLTPNDWALLRSKSRRQSFQKGDAIIQINNRPAALFIIEKGSANVEVTSGSVIAKLAPGDVCGEMAFLENNVASASVLAAESDTEVDAIGFSEGGCYLQQLSPSGGSFLQIAGIVALTASAANLIGTGQVYG